MNKTLVSIIATIGVLAMAGCAPTSAAPASTAEAANSETTALNVGAIATADCLPLYLGVAKGFFQEQNLKVTIQSAAGGAALVPAVISGSQEIAYSNVVSLMLGADKGLPLQIIANGDATNEKAADDVNGILVKSDSPIKTPADLAGKTIAVNTLKNIVALAVSGTLDKQGVDTSGIKMVEIGFPDMAAALSSGRVDAIAVTEPFLSQSLAQGARNVSALFQPIYPALTIGAYFTSNSYAAKHPEIVKRFQAAMAKSLAYTQEHPDEARAELAKYTKISPDVINKMHLGTFTEKLNVPAVNALADLMVKFGYTSSRPDVAKLTAGAK